MLENLDKIDWSKLLHAYGPASDVPGLLRELTSAEEEVRDAAYGELYSNIWHQGTVYEASSYAVPFLIELLEQPEVREKERVLGLLEAIAHGSSYNAAHADLTIFEKESQTEEYQREMQIQLGWVRQAYLAVREGLPVYRVLLNHPEPAVRAGAADLLATFTEKEEAPASARLLLARFSREENSAVKNSLVTSLGFLAKPGTAEAELLHGLLSARHEEPLLRQLAAAALSRVMGESVPEEAVEILVKVITGQRKDQAWYGGPDSIGADSASKALLRIGVERGVPALARALTGAADPEAALAVAEALLGLAFSERRQKVILRSYSHSEEGREQHKYSLKEETALAIDTELENGLGELKAGLTVRRREAVAAIVGADPLWALDTNLYRVYRLPITRQELASLL
ncbi:MAG TPA: hypothetical protein VH186_20930 [Chloroflexia bacterium]|nr:hypothetical protein [Chloroflexia bacterium]